MVPDVQTVTVSRKHTAQSAVGIQSLVDLSGRSLGVTVEASETLASEDRSGVDEEVLHVFTFG